MSKAIKLLPDAIKEIVNQYGKDILNDVRLVNILCDVISFSEAPASKAILREMLKNGYGNKILAIDIKQPDKGVKKQSLITEVSKQYGYKVEIVDYIVSSVVYGLGWKIKKPSIIPEEKHIEIINTKNALSDLNGELKIQKQNYIQLLEKLITIPPKGSGYYSASALSDLYLVEGKIHLLNDALNIKDDANWCKDEMQKVLQKYFVDTTKIRKTYYTIAAIVAILFLAFVSYGAYYMVTLDERKAYKQLWQESESLYVNGNYKELISKYQQVFDDYPSFCSYSNKKEASSRILNICENAILGEGKNIVEFDKAVKMTEAALSIPLGVDYKDKISKQFEVANNQLKRRIDLERVILIDNISSNKGKLDAKGLAQLKVLYNLYPNDYWFNFLMKKNNE